MKVGPLRALFGAAMAVCLFAAPMIAQAAQIDAVYAVAAARAQTAARPKASSTQSLAARNAQLARTNRVLRDRLAKERRENAQLQRQVGSLTRLVHRLQARVTRLLVVIRDLRWRMSMSFGPWRRAVASTYGIGDGLLGSGLAGSGRLTAARPVFAHKTMPFGTKVQFSYKGKSFVGECQDRGPFIAGREFDVGPRIARELRFGGVGAVKWRVVRRR